MERLIIGLVFIIFVVGCDIRENAIMREQSETFTKEIKYRQKTNQELSNKLDVALEEIRMLEAMLTCQEELVDQRVGGIYSQDPIMINEDDLNPAKSNKAKEERAKKE